MKKKFKHWFYKQCYYQALNRPSDEVVMRWFRIRMNKYKQR